MFEDGTVARVQSLTAPDVVPEKKIETAADPIAADDLR